MNRLKSLIKAPLRFLVIRGEAWLISLLSNYPVLVPYFSALVPDRLVGKKGKAFWVAVGYNLFQQDLPVPAWIAFERSIRAGHVTTDEYLLGAMCLYHGLGRFRDAMGLFDSANKQNMAEVKRRGLDKLPVRILDNVWARHIGHTATIDYVIKMGMQEGRAPENTMMYLPRGAKIANRFLLDQVAKQIRLIEDPADLPVEADAVQALHYNYLGPRLPDGTTFYFSKLANTVYKRWFDEQGNRPLFTLPPEIEARGREALRKAGMPDGAWFVALHVREGKFDGKSGGLHGILNCDVDTYLPAVQEITRRGGWVVRMGDPGMKPLPPMPNFINYCHSDWRADWLDVFFAAKCRFMLGSCSGPAFIPPIYGVPCVLTNWWPPAERAWHAADIFIPKRIRRKADGAYLTLGETLTEPFSWCHSRRYLSEHQGVTVEENDADVIVAGVKEMFGRLEGELAPAEIAVLRAKSDTVYEQHGVPGMAQLSAEFVRRYPEFIV